MRRAIARLKHWAKRLWLDVLALWMGASEPLMPIGARLLAGLVAAYALSPIDLIPDFVPLLGYLDDLVLVPTGIALAVRLTPPALMAELRIRAASAARPRTYLGAGLIVTALLLGAAALFLALRG